MAPTSPAPPPAADVSEDETQYRLDTIYGVSIPAEHMLVHAWILKRRDQEADEIAPADQVALFKRLVYRRHPEGYKDAHVAAGIPQTKDAPVSWRQLRLLAREAAIRCPLGSEPAQVSGQPAAASKDVAPCKG